MKPPIAFAPRTEELPLEAALLIYGTQYVTKHDVVHAGKGAPSLGPGRPLDRATLAALLAAAGRDVGLSGWVDPRVLYIGPELVVWHTEEQRRTMFFKCERDKDVGQLRNCAGLAPQPPLVWAVRGTDWYVWATRTIRGAPDADTQLYQAPYLNVYDDGGICTGNARVPRHLSTEAIDGFEKAFYDSRFTHPNAARLTDHPSGIYGLWRDLLDHSDEEGLVVSLSFPIETLVPLNLTLGDIVRRLTKESP